MDLLHDKRFESFNIPPSKTSKGELEDKIYDVLDYQLHVLEQMLANNGIEVQSASIQGEELQEKNVVKIELAEDNSPSYYRGRGKDKKLLKAFSIVIYKRHSFGRGRKSIGKNILGSQESGSR